MSLRPFRDAASVALMLILLGAGSYLRAGRKRSDIRFDAKPGQVAEMPAPSITARRPCENWGWAASVETLLKSAGVAMPQNFWVMRANGGEVCVANPENVLSLNQFIDGDFALDDGRRIRVESHYVPNQQISVEDLILALRNQQPRIMFWKNRAYVIYGMVYDELIAPAGVRRYQWKQFKLIDPMYSDPKQREVVLNSDHDDPADLAGILAITAAPRALYELKK